MDSVRSALSGPTGMFVRVVFILLAFYILYLIYQFLYGTSDLNDYNVVSEVTVARESIQNTNGLLTYQNTDKETKIFKIGDGSDFSLGFWIYIKDINYSTNNNKFILSLGGTIPKDATQQSVTPDEQFLVIYLGGAQYSLKVKTNARNRTIQTTSTTESPLSGNNIKKIFTELPVQNLSENQADACDINQIDIQKWVYVAITYSSRTLDVYIDGKLARSCIVGDIKPTTNYKLNLFGFGGYGGFFSNLTTHDYALNPEQIWRYYMAGPGPKYTLLQWLQTLFDPQAIGSLQYPKYPTDIATTN